MLTRCPPIFTMVWKLARPLLSEDTRAKVQIFGERDDHIAALAKMVDVDQIPRWLGGTSAEEWVWGDAGEVPRGPASRRSSLLT